MPSRYVVQETSVGDVSVRYMTAGQGEPLVYLHGAFGYQGWPPFLDALAEDHTVYAPILPGFGENGGIDRIDDVLDLTLFHHDLIEALGIDAPNVVGHHLGAMIAAEMAAVCPRSVYKLVLAAPVGLWLDDQPGVDYFATPATELRAVLFGDPRSQVALEVMPEPADDEEKAAQAVERARSLSAAGKFLWPIPDKGLKKRLRRIKAPALVVVGENDRIVPPVYGDEFCKRIPSARLHTIAGAGHMFIYEKPDEFARQVAGFLA